LKQCYVYFIQQGESGPIKIGIAGNVEKRKTNLQISNPYTLKTLLVIPHKTKTLAENSEQYLHWLFRKSRMLGEWFKPDPFLTEGIDRVKNLPASEMVANLHTHYINVWHEISNPINNIHNAIEFINQQINEVVMVKAQYEDYGDVQTSEAILWELKDTLRDIAYSKWHKWLNQQMLVDKQRRESKKRQNPEPLKIINLQDTGS